MGRTVLAPIKDNGHIEWLQGVVHDISLLGDIVVKIPGYGTRMYDSGYHDGYGVPSQALRPLLVFLDGPKTGAILV